MVGNFKARPFLANKQFSEHIKADENSAVLKADIYSFSAILNRVCWANRGKWETIIADAIAFRYMDERSVNAWKLCAKAGLIGGDLEAARDCLHKPLHINYKDQKACAILESLVEDHLKTLKVRRLNPIWVFRSSYYKRHELLQGTERKGFECDSWKRVKCCNWSCW